MSAATPRRIARKDFLIETLMPIYPCILRHPSEPWVLLLRGEGGWSLPSIALEGGWFVHRVGPIAREVSAQLGIDVTGLRHIRHREIDFCELENHSPEWTPPAYGRWIGQQELGELVFADLDQREVVENWLSEAERRDIPILRPPWERRGWFKGASAWIQEQLNALGCTAVGPIEQFKAAWGASCLLRVPTITGPLWFKADYAKPPSEPALLLALAERWPENVPAILAHQSEQRWMLMRDFGGVEINDQSLCQCQEAVRLFAELQVDCAACLDRWWALDCPDLRLETLPGRLEQMLADPGATQPGTPQDLEEAEIERLRALAPRLGEMCARLEEHGLPATLVNQDFRTGNIIALESSYLFYDWSDTVIAHPFFSPVRFLQVIRLPEERYRAISEAYLEPWTRFQPMKRLREAFALTRRLNLLYQAIRWHHDARYLETTAPYGRDIISGLPQKLRNVLQQDGTGGSTL